MTRNSRARLALATLIALGLAAGGAQAQTAIAAYNFDGTTDGTTGTAPAAITPSAGAATFSNNFVAQTDIVFQSGPVGNKTTTSANADYALRLNSGGGTSTTGTGQVEEGRYVQFNVSTVGYRNISLAYLTQRSNSGFLTQTVQYSTDGTTFTTFATYSPVLAGTAGANYNASFDFSSVAGLNNDPSAAFRITVTGSIVGQSVTSNDRLDDLAIMGTAVAAPEPGGVAAMVIGIGALGLLAARRRVARA